MKREIELILLAVLVDKSNEEMIKISDILDCELDWIYISGIIVNHRLSGYFYNRLNEEQKSKIPKEFREVLKLIVSSQRTRQTYINHEVNVINSKLQKHRIRFAGLKGVLYGTVLYNNGDRRSNDIDLLVIEDDVSALDKALREMGYIQSNMNNGELVEASKKEKLIQRLNYHDLVPYVKKTDIGIIEIDINFIFDGKENPVENLVFSDGVNQYTGNDYSIMGLSIPMNLAFLCVHFYREATNSLWTEGKRDLLLYKLVDIMNFIRKFRNELAYDQIISVFKSLNIDKKCYYVFTVINEFYSDTFIVRMMELLSYVDKENLGQIYNNITKQYKKRTRSFYDSIFN